jgi:hypothetical protein
MKDKDKEQQRRSLPISCQSLNQWQLGAFLLSTAMLPLPSTSQTTAISCAVHTNLIYSSHFFPGHRQHR